MTIRVMLEIDGPPELPERLAQLAAAGGPADLATPFGLFPARLTLMPAPAGDAQCGHAPVNVAPWGSPGLLACTEPAGHADGKPAERHKSYGYWWSERQQAPVQQGHVHSTGYFCSPICPGWTG